MVDKKVNLAVAEVGGAATRVAIGSNDQVTTFTVTNLTNSIQDFHLVPGQRDRVDPRCSAPTTSTSPACAPLSIERQRLTYDAGVDTATFIDELAPDATVTVFIVANVPNTAGIHTAIVGLNAIVAAGGASGSLGARSRRDLAADG